MKRFLTAIKRFYMRSLLLLAAAALFTVTTAWASNAGTSTTLSDVLTETVLPLISALALAFLTKLLKDFARKYGLEAGLKEQEALEKAAWVGITFAEEKARSAIKSRLPNISGESKLALAVDHVLRAVPKVDRERAAEVVEGLLYQARSPQDAPARPVRKRQGRH